MLKSFLWGIDYPMFFFLITFLVIISLRRLCASYSIILSIQSPSSDGK